jgi:glycosyltransferase involved in cell wall biosynthesis
MKPLRITIVLPFPVTKPVGGPKIMYEYANRFHALGHTITVVHSLKRPFKKMKSPLWWKRFVFFLQGAARPKWFPLHKDIQSVIVDEITDQFLPDADIVFSTWWQMTYAIAELSASKGIKVNLIQDFENWGGQEQNVIASYKLPVHHSVIARYLETMVNKYSKEPVAYFPNAIDTKKFSLFIPIESRNPRSIISLYSEEKRKGTTYTLEALAVLKNKYPDLVFTFFGVYPRPKDLPAWINYYRKPSNLPELYNANAIFLSSSLGEGWALPPAEAMACGCAVVCTNIGGHADYAIDEKTALLTEPASASSIVHQIEKLFASDALRVELARAGNENLKNSFNWEHSVSTVINSFANWQKN